MAKHSSDRPFFGLEPTASSERSAIKNHFVAASGEFVGTFMFLFIAFLGHQAAVSQAPSQAAGGGNSELTVFYISLSYGISLLVAVWTMYRISGGLFNPAVTLGMVITGSLPAVRGVILFPAQLLGCMCAAAVAEAIVPQPIGSVRTTLASGVSVAQGLFLEMFLTAMLVFTVLMLAAEKSKDTFIAPIGIGLALFICEIAGVYYTGGSLNPARSFGPCVASRTFEGYHWIYWIGPGLGALVAAGYYTFVKWFNYEEANPGQDSAGGQVADEDDIKELKEGQGQQRGNNARGAGGNGNGNSNGNGNGDRV